jgi:hypothetical protein
MSSPPVPKDPSDLYSYITWFKLREPLLGDSIKAYTADNPWVTTSEI